MKKYLITLLIIPTLIFADAVIFSGSDVKTLKPNIDLFGVAKILTTSTIPTAGLTAPKGSIAMYLTTGDLYLKTGALNTDWTKNQTGPVSLTTDVTGILPIANGGTGSATQNFVDLTTDQTVAGAKTFTGTPTAFTPTASTTAATTRFLFTGAADTTLTASTEAPNVYFNMGQTRQHSTGTLSTQRDFRISPSTHSFVGASTLTNAAALSIDGPANGGTNATITNSSALYVPTSALTNVTNSYGLNVAATTGATNNYAAVFNGGWVGIGTTAPLASLNVTNFVSGAAETVGIALHNVASGSGLPAYGFGMGPTVTEGYLTYRSGTALSSAFGHKWFVNDTEYMRLRGDGKLGLGLSAPTSFFHMYESNSTTGAANGQTIEQAGTGDATQHFLLTAGQRYTMGIDNSDSDKFKIGTNADLGTSNLLTITNAGNVGIGTTTPASLFNVNNGSLTVDGGSIGTQPINGARLLVDAGPSLAHVLMKVRNSSVDAVTVLGTGNVGIGVTAPNANAILDVTSTTKAFMPPRMTTAQKNSVASPAAGMVVYDTDMKGISFYNGTAWTTANNKNVATKTANYTILQSDDVILGDATSGAITITLPTAVGFSGKVFNIKKTDSSINSVTIATTSSQTIDGALTEPLISQYQSLTLVSNGTNWSVL